MSGRPLFVASWRGIASLRESGGRLPGRLWLTHERHQIAHWDPEVFGDLLMLRAPLRGVSPWDDRSWPERCLEHLVDSYCRYGEFREGLLWGRELKTRAKASVRRRDVLVFDDLEHARAAVKVLLLAGWMPQLLRREFRRAG